MLSGEARRAALILHQTLGWRWRRKVCLTERSQQRQSGPWWTAWFHDRCNRVDSDACRGGNAGARAGCTARNEIHAGVDSIVSKNLAYNGVAAPRDTRAEPLGDAQMAASERVRVAPPGSDTWTSADSPDEARPSYRSGTASPQRRRGVTVPSLIETICEL